METNKKSLLIGLFIVATSTIFVVLIWILGSGLIFSNKITYVMYFNESVKGLRKGAKVAFKGVSVGEVQEVNVILDSQTFLAKNQVIVTIDKNRLKTNNEDLFDFGMSTKKMTNLLVDKGLRAQLQTESIVTGVLMINLDFDKTVPVKLFGRNEDFIEIPTKPSGISQITQTLDKIQFDQAIAKLMKILDNLDNFTSQASLGSTIKNLDSAIVELQKTTSYAGNVLKKVDKEIDPLVVDVKDVIQNTTQTFKDLQKTINGLNDIVGEDSKTKYKLEETIESINRASKSISTLTDYLTRHPDAVIYGKK